jgi:hypothetical protein
MSPAPSSKYERRKQAHIEGKQGYVQYFEGDKVEIGPYFKYHIPEDIPMNEKKYGGCFHTGYQFKVGIVNAVELPGQLFTTLAYCPKSKNYPIDSIGSQLCFLVHRPLKNHIKNLILILFNKNLDYKEYYAGN